VNQVSWKPEKALSKASHGVITSMENFWLDFLLIEKKIINTSNSLLNDNDSKDLVSSVFPLFSSI
jgi:hypothetical protein